MPQSKASFKVVVSTDTEDLSKRVQSLLDEGYDLHGSLIMSVDGQAKRHFAQAVFLPSDDWFDD